MGGPFGFGDPFSAGPSTGGWSPERGPTRRSIRAPLPALGRLYGRSMRISRSPPSPPYDQTYFMGSFRARADAAAAAGQVKRAGARGGSPRLGPVRTSALPAGRRRPLYRNATAISTTSTVATMSSACTHSNRSLDNDHKSQKWANRSDRRISHSSRVSRSSRKPPKSAASHASRTSRMSCRSQASRASRASHASRTSRASRASRKSRSSRSPIGPCRSSSRTHKHAKCAAHHQRRTRELFKRVMGAIDGMLEEEENDEEEEEEEEDEEEEGIAGGAGWRGGRRGGWSGRRGTSRGVRRPVATPAIFAVASQLPFISAQDYPVVDIRRTNIVRPERSQNKSPKKEVNSQPSTATRSPRRKRRRQESVNLRRASVMRRAGKSPQMGNRLNTPGCDPRQKCLKAPDAVTITPHPRRRLLRRARLPPSPVLMVRNPSRCQVPERDHSPPPPPATALPGPFPTSRPVCVWSSPSARTCKVPPPPLPSPTPVHTLQPGTKDSSATILIGNVRLPSGITSNTSSSHSFLTFTADMPANPVRDVAKEGTTTFGKAVGFVHSPNFPGSYATMPTIANLTNSTAPTSCNEHVRHNVNSRATTSYVQPSAESQSTLTTAVEVRTFSSKGGTRPLPKHQDSPTPASFPTTVTHSDVPRETCPLVKSSKNPMVRIIPIISTDTLHPCISSAKRRSSCTTISYGQRTISLVAKHKSFTSIVNGRDVSACDTPPMTSSCTLSSQSLTSMMSDCLSSTTSSQELSAVAEEEEENYSEKCGTLAKRSACVSTQSLNVASQRLPQSVPYPRRSVSQAAGITPPCRPRPPTQNHVTHPVHPPTSQSPRLQPRLRSSHSARSASTPSSSTSSSTTLNSSAASTSGGTADGIRRKHIAKREDFEMSFLTTVRAPKRLSRACIKAIRKTVVRSLAALGPSLVVTPLRARAGLPVAVRSDPSIVFLHSSRRRRRACTAGLRRFRSHDRALRVVPLSVPPVVNGACVPLEPSFWPPVQAKTSPNRKWRGEGGARSVLSLPALFGTAVGCALRRRLSCPAEAHSLPAAAPPRTSLCKTTPASPSAKPPSKTNTIGNDPLAHEIDDALLTRSETKEALLNDADDYCSENVSQEESELLRSAPEHIQAAKRALEAAQQHTQHLLRLAALTMASVEETVRRRAPQPRRPPKILPPHTSPPPPQPPPAQPPQPPPAQSLRPPVARGPRILALDPTRFAGPTAGTARPSVPIAASRLVAPDRSLSVGQYKSSSSPKRPVHQPLSSARRGSRLRAAMTRSPSPTTVPAVPCPLPGGGVTGKAAGDKRVPRMGRVQGGDYQPRVAETAEDSSPDACTACGPRPVESCAGGVRSDPSVVYRRARSRLRRWRLARTQAAVLRRFRSRDGALCGGAGMLGRAAPTVQRPRAPPRTPAQAWCASDFYGVQRPVRDVVRASRSSACPAGGCGGCGGSGDLGPSGGEESATNSAAGAEASRGGGEASATEAHNRVVHTRARGGSERARSLPTLGSRATGRMRQQGHSYRNTQGITPYTAVTGKRERCTTRGHSRRREETFARVRLSLVTPLLGVHRRQPPSDPPPVGATRPPAANAAAVTAAAAAALARATTATVRPTPASKGSPPRRELPSRIAPARRLAASGLSPPRSISPSAYKIRMPVVPTNGSTYLGSPCLPITSLSVGPWLAGATQPPLAPSPPPQLPSPQPPPPQPSPPPAVSPNARGRLRWQREWSRAGSVPPYGHKSPPTRNHFSPPVQLRPRVDPMIQKLTESEMCAVRAGVVTGGVAATANRGGPYAANSCSVSPSGIPSVTVTAAPNAAIPGTACSRGPYAPTVIPAPITHGVRRAPMERSMRRVPDCGTQDGAEQERKPTLRPYWRW